MDVDYRRHWTLSGHKHEKIKEESACVVPVYYMKYKSLFKFSVYAPRPMLDLFLMF